MMIEIKCFHTGNDVINYEELGIKRPTLEDSALEPITFLKIDNIQKYFENDKEYSIIQSGSSEFICKLKYEELKKILLEAKKNETNYIRNSTE
jgi:hypothetical protein